MPELSFGIPSVLGVTFTKEEVERFWKGVGQKVGRQSKVKEFEKLFGRYSRVQAESILKVLYQQYFERDLDDVGRKFYTPYIQNFGFMGIMWVTYHLLQSEEMSKKVSRDLGKLYQKHLHREPDPTGMVAYDKWIRFFGKSGRKYVERHIKKSNEYGAKH